MTLGVGSEETTHDASIPGKLRDSQAADRTSSVSLQNGGIEGNRVLDSRLKYLGLIRKSLSEGVIASPCPVRRVTSGLTMGFTEESRSKSKCADKTPEKRCLCATPNALRTEILHFVLINPNLALQTRTIKFHTVTCHSQNGTEAKT